MHGQIRADDVRVMLSRRSGSRKGSGEDLRDASAQVDFWDFLDVLKRRADLPLRFRQGHPKLRPIQNAAVVTRCFFGMSNAVSRSHDVHAAGPNQTFVAETVMVNDLSFQQPGDGLKPDVRMWRNVHRLAFGKHVRAVPIEKAPGANQPFSL